MMNPTRKLHELGQRLWLDNITRTMLDDGTLARYIRDFSVTGLTSNPTIFQHAISAGDAYDQAIDAAPSSGSTEDIFNDLAIADLSRAADLFRPVHDATDGLDGWVSLEVSPLLVDDSRATVDVAAKLHKRAARDNLFIKIPGTPAGLVAIEESIFAGVPINVTLLFTCEQYLAAANAYLRGIERRIEAGRDPRVASVASLFISRWDVAVQDKVPAELHNRLGIAIAGQTWRAYRELLGSPRWRDLHDAGARVQRLLWASTGTKDPKASDTLYIEALAAPDTIDTMPDKTLLAFADHGKLDATMPDDGGDWQAVIAKFRDAGIDVDSLGEQLQREGAQSFSASWNKLMDGIADKRRQANPKAVTQA
jgi:transaldolase